MKFHRMFMLFSAFSVILNMQETENQQKEVSALNIAYFLIPKSSVAFLYDDYTFRQGLEKMRHHGYTAIPVISRTGQYIGIVSEGDFLWRMLASSDDESEKAFSMKNMEKLHIRDILNANHPPVRITVSMEDLLSSAANQNFVPVVDDLGNFTGIVTRKDIIRYFSEKRAGNTQPELLRKIV